MRKQSLPEAKRQFLLKWLPMHVSMELLSQFLGLTISQIRTFIKRSKQERILDEKLVVSAPINFKNLQQAYASILKQYQAGDVSAETLNFKKMVYQKIRGKIVFPVEIFEGVFQYYTPIPSNGYEKLLVAMFGPSNFINADEVVASEIEAMISEMSQPLPLADFAELLNSRIFGGLISGRWSHTLFSLERKLIDAALLTLTTREAKVISLRFGLDSKEHTLAETAKALNPGDPVGDQRIRQIEAKALRKLRHPSRNKVLKESVFAGLAVRCSRLSDLVIELRLQLGQSPVTLELIEDNPGVFISAKTEALDRRVDELEISVRSYNCLKSGGINTVRELVRKSEADLLKIQFFGRKCLNEVKDILESMGLGLEMQLKD